MGGHPLRVRVSGPLSALGVGFAADLTRQGYRRNAVADQLCVMAHLSRWLEANGLGPSALSQPVEEAFLEARRAQGYRLWLSRKGLAPMLSYLRDRGVVPPVAPPARSHVDALLARYHDYLVGERGLAVTTARGYVDMVRPFVMTRATPAGVDLARLTTADVIRFVVASCPIRSRGSAKLTVTSLRSLLRFLHVEGFLAASLTAAVPSVANWRLTSIPRRLEPREVADLLATCDRRTAVGRRDFAILMMLVRLGLRAGEVRSLTLDDIDWRVGELVVRGKANRAERLPLPADVGEAVAAYLRRGRPATVLSRAVFTRVRAPHRSLSSAAISFIVGKAGQRAGLGKFGAHVLRHTAASQMVRAGVPLPEVAQVLRHRRLQTTAIYAKVDREGLRSLACPWPGGDA